MPDFQRQMQTIKTAWGRMLADACATSSVPVSFLAALIANESGGDNAARRFESHVLLQLWEVVQGRKAAFGSIGRSDLVNYLSAQRNGDPARGVGSLPADSFQRLDALATSYGLTQIMGYNAMARGDAVSDLAVPEKHLRVALVMLAGFAHEFSLDVAQDFSELFRCWNTGRPDGQTADPAYAQNGLDRMAAYEALP